MYGYLIIKPDNSVELVESESHKFTISELQKAVDCDTINIVRGPAGFYLCCDDNFIAAKKDFNLIASCLYCDYMAGNVVLGYNENSYLGEEADIYKMPIEHARTYKDDIDGKDFLSI